MRDTTDQTCVARQATLNSACVEDLSDDLIAACVDAGTDPSMVRLYRFSTPHLVEGSFVPAGVLLPLHANLDARQQEDVSEHVASHRIAVQDGLTIPFSARFRHELEHCAQYQLAGAAIFSLTDEIDNAFQSRHGGARGFELLRYVGPVEGDANGAAASFVRSHFIDAELDAFDSIADRLLLDPTAPPPERETLAIRQGCFAAVVDDELLRTLGMRLAPMLAAIGEGARVAWETARRDVEIRRLTEVAKREAPSPLAAGAADASEMADLWDPAVQATALAYRRALSVNRLD